MSKIFNTLVYDFPWTNRPIVFRAILLFAIFNGLLAALVASSNVPWSQIATDSRTLVFLLLAFPGHFIFLALLPVLLVYVLLRWSRWPIFNTVLMVVLAFVYQALVLVDTKTFELYRFHLNSMVWNLMTGGEAGQILSFSTSVYLTGFAVIAGVLIALMLLWRLSGVLAVRAVKHTSKLLLLALVVVMGSGQFLYAHSDASGYTPVTTASNYIAWPLKVTMKRFLRRQGVKVVNVGQSSDLSMPSFSTLNYPKNPLQCELNKPLNVLIIMVDSLRFDMLTPEIMPNTYAFAQQANVFDSHYSTGNATRFGVFGFFYGLTGNYWFPMVQQQQSPVLLDLLQDNHYVPYIYAAVPLTSPEFDRTVFSRFKGNWNTGIRMSKQKDLPPEWQKRHYDSYITQALVKDLKNHDPQQPFFSFLFYDAPHNFTFDRLYEPKFKPHLDQVNYLVLNNDYDPEPFFNLYKNSVNYDDGEIAQILAVLREQKLLDNTVVIISSDHGQEFNDVKENYWGHNSNFSDYQTRVPMIVSWPGDEPRSITYRTSHEDVVPTLVERLFSCKNQVSDYSTGHSLYSDVARDNLVVSWSKRAVMDENYIYVFGGLDSGAVYDYRYQRKPDVQASPKTLVQSLDKMSAFLQ